MPKTYSKKEAIWLYNVLKYAVNALGFKVSNDVAYAVDTSPEDFLQKFFVHRYNESFVPTFESIVPEAYQYEIGTPGDEVVESLRIGGSGLADTNWTIELMADEPIIATMSGKPTGKGDLRCRSLVACLEGLITNILNRSFASTTTELYFDDFFEMLAKLSLYNAANGDTIEYTQEELTNLVAKYCADNKIIWNDSDYRSQNAKAPASVAQINSLKKTKFGKQLAIYGCFASLPTEGKDISAEVDVLPTEEPAKSTSTKSYTSDGEEDTNKKTKLTDLKSVIAIRTVISSPIQVVLEVDGIEFKPNQFLFVKTQKVDKSSPAYHPVLFGNSKDNKDVRCIFKNISDAKNFVAGLPSELLTALIVKFKLDAGTQTINYSYKKYPGSGNEFVQINTAYGPVYLPRKKIAG